MCPSRSICTHALDQHRQLNSLQLSLLPFWLLIILGRRWNGERTRMCFIAVQEISSAPPSVHSNRLSPSLPPSLRRCGLPGLEVCSGASSMKEGADIRLYAHGRVGLGGGGCHRQSITIPGSGQANLFSRTDIDPIDQDPHSACRGISREYHPSLPKSHKAHFHPTNALPTS